MSNANEPTPRHNDSIQPPADIIVGPDTQRDHRIPPGQVLTAVDSRTGRAKWPVLDASGTPQIDLERWQLRFFGLVDQEVAFDWRQFGELPKSRVRCDIHCVTRWSRLDNLFEGPTVRTVLKRLAIRPEARFVVVYAHDKVGGDWSTNLPLDAFCGDDCLFATHHDGVPLAPAHGGPCRLVVPKLYFWKSAKWVKAVEFLAQDRPGFWERNGYHMVGDPWREQRHRW